MSPKHPTDAELAAAIDRGITDGSIIELTPEVLDRMAREAGLPAPRRRDRAALRAPRVAQRWPREVRVHRLPVAVRVRAPVRRVAERRHPPPARRTPRRPHRKGLTMHRCTCILCQFGEHCPDCGVGDGRIGPPEPGCDACRVIGPLLTAPGTSGRSWRCECGTVWSHPADR